MDYVSTQPLHDLAKTLERLTPKLSELSIAIGFDAFIDETIRIVGEHSTPESYTPMPTIGEYGELVRRIFSTDPDERMPPPESHKQLDEAQKELLKRWISEGAEYQPHWAFILPKKSPPPAVEQNRWARNSIDGFILARFEREPRTNSRVATEVRDTVGAGDAFTAAFLIGLLRGDAHEVILARANKLAAAVCSQPGAVPDLPLPIH